MEEIVRWYDYDRYLSALFAHSKARPHLLALYAFNYEIAKTVETVSQPALGLIRLNWWRETVEGIYAGQLRKHEVAMGLARAVEQCRLPREALDAMIEARESDLEETPFASMAQLKSYADATSGNAMRLALRVLGAGEAFDAAAREAGIAYALVGLLRALPHRAARRNLVVPLDFLKAAGLTEDDVFSGHAGTNLKPIIAEIAGQAMVHYRAAEAVRVPRRVLPALLPACLVPAFARAVTAKGFEPFRDVVDIPLHRRQWAMLGAMAGGRI
jgi:phytoene/squalene synthetase